MTRAQSLLLLPVLFLVGCGSIPRETSLKNPEVIELLQAARNEGDKRKVFTPVLPDSEVRLEQAKSGGYHKMLHISSRAGKIRRTIAFRKDGEKYRWIGEQETFYAPKTYVSPDGEFPETVMFTYDSSDFLRTGSPTNCLSVIYSGDDAEMPGVHVKVPDALRKLKEWGFDSEYLWISSAVTSQPIVYCWPLN